MDTLYFNQSANKIVQIQQLSQNNAFVI